MSKGIGESPTQTSEYSYEHEAENNNALATQMLQTMYPELFAFEEAREKFGLTREDLLDLMYNIQLVKTHGYGSVKLDIAQHQITKQEALIRTLKFRELEERAKPQE